MWSDRLPAPASGHMLRPNMLAIAGPAMQLTHRCSVACTLPRLPAHLLQGVQWQAAPRRHNAIGQAGVQQAGVAGQADQQLQGHGRR